MGSLSRATNKTTSMRAPGLSLLAAVVVISVSDALSTLNGRVDEEHNAIVVEAEDSAEGRESRQLWPIQPVLRINEEDTINFGITPFQRAPVNARCALKEGGEGNCMSLKSCYPYFKIPSLAMYDTWVMGLQADRPLEFAATNLYPLGSRGLRTSLNLSPKTLWSTSFRSSSNFLKTAASATLGPR